MEAETGNGFIGSRTGLTTTAEKPMSQVILDRGDSAGISRCPLPSRLLMEIHVSHPRERKVVIRPTLILSLVRMQTGGDTARVVEKSADGTIHRLGSATHGMAPRS